MKVPPLSIVICAASCALATMGTKACQEDYDLGSQTTISTPTEGSTVSPTASPTVSPTLRDPTVIVSVTAVVSPSITVSVTVSPSVFVSVNPSVTGSPNIKPSVSTKTPVPDKVTTSASSMLVAPLNNVNNDGGGGNWLGRAFSDYGKNGKDNQGHDDDDDDDDDDQSIVPKSLAWVDSDGDGFSDDFELEHGSAVYGAGSTPQLVEDSDRWSYLGEDGDGDGCPDALRSIIGESVSTADSDGDCLPDIFEMQQGLVAEASDSDSDSVPDGIEVLAGSSIHRVDTDGDGVSDYQELRLGLDPRLPNFTEDK
jgi:hypothetical protein